MSNPYPLSRDYAKLYALILGGAEIVCFVDYKIIGGEMWRDIAKCRFIDGQFHTNVRGTAYGMYYSVNFCKTDRKTFFIRDCERMNLEFIDPEDFNGKNDCG